MAQFCVNENTCMDIIEVNGAYYATLWIHDFVYNFGPVYDITSLIQDIRMALKDINSAMHLATNKAFDGLKFNELVSH